MKKIGFIFLGITLLLKGESLDSLLQEYEVQSKKSLQTVDEKLGHVRIYSQKEIQLMQYDKLSDLLKELPINNLNKNRFGMNNLALAGAKTEISGYFRFYINDHEISSTYDQSPFLSWGDLPLDFIDHIEVYYGEGSFSLGNETGLEAIRIYTKVAKKENGGAIKVSGSI